MRFKQWALSLLSLSLSCTPSAWSHPEVFSDYSLEQAKQQAQKDNKFLILDFMATWCPPCKKMESSTWTDNAVQTWITENAIAVQIDVDKDRKVSSAFHIEAMPTVVLMAPGGAKECGRQVGYIDAGELLQWLKGAKDGKANDGKTVPQSPAGGESVWERISKARAAQAAGKNDEALAEYLWLWSNISDDDPQLGNVRTSLVCHELGVLIASYPPTKSKLAELRDAAEKSGNRGDWILLNSLLNETPRTLAWFDKAKIDPKQLDAFKKHTKLLEPILFSKGRWADAVKYLYPDPMATLNEYYQRAQDMKKPRPHTEFAPDFDPFPPMVLLLYGSYVGAGLDADAQKIFDECLRLDNTPDMRTGLENMGKGMRQARAVQGKAVN